MTDDMDLLLSAPERLREAAPSVPLSGRKHFQDDAGHSTPGTSEQGEGLTPAPEDSRLQPS